MAYKTINGVKYEKELLDLATKHTTGKGEGKLSKDEVAELFKSANDGKGITATERKTLEYIRNNYEFTDASAKDFDEAFAQTAPSKATAKSDTAKESTVKATTSSILDISETQLDATAEQVITALTTLNEQIDSAREIGSDKAKDIVKGFGGETKVAELIEKLAGYMGEAAATGITIGAAPMIIMAGTAKGVYKKITD